MTAKVAYQIGTYSGTVTVYGVEPDDENEYIIARAKAQLRREFGPMPGGLYHESWKVVERSET